MLKLTAVIAVLTIAAASPQVQASPEESPASDAKVVHQSGGPSKTVIEEVPPVSSAARRDQSPITVNPTDLPKACPRSALQMDEQSMAAIPTWPSYFETVKMGKNRYAASYVTEAGSQTPPANSSPSVNWGPDVVPVVEVLPPAASAGTRQPAR